MKGYEEVYEEWFDNKDDVIVISEDDYTKLVLGFCGNFISVGYIIQLGDNYGISIDSQFKANWDLLPDDDATEYLTNPQHVIYQIMFNIIGCMMHNRGIKHRLDMSQINKKILGLDLICRYSISNFKRKLLKPFINSHFH